MQQEWQNYYNQDRGHSGLGRLTPQQKQDTVQSTIPSVEQVHNEFHPLKEQQRTISRYTWVKVEMVAPP